MLHLLLRNNKGQTGAWEGIIILILLIVISGLVFLIYNKKTEANQYFPESKPVIVDVKPNFGGCASTSVERWKDEINNPISNSAKH